MKKEPCKHERYSVKDSRFRDGHRFRLKECLICGKRLSTVEIVLVEFNPKRFARQKYDKSLHRIALVNKLTDDQCIWISKLLGFNVNNCD